MYIMIATYRKRITSDSNQHGDSNQYGDNKSSQQGKQPKPLVDYDSS